jgi:DNA polymerase-3 subunit alpha
MTKYLKDLKPTTVHDINAMVALYRPGPIEMIPEYIDRKHHPEKIKYLDPRMKDFLDQSYGVITYQDDVMLTAINLAGYSWLEADKLRKAMGKKIPAEMQAQKEKLLKGFIEHGLTEKKANTLWKLIEPFAAYGFNKAHAASYGRVAYQTAYMKANFPAIYMSAVLTADSGDVEKIGEFMTDCKKMGIPVLPPSVNESYRDFTVVKTPGASVHSVGADRDKIRFGLTTIKNFGEEIARVIIEERKKNGKFTSLSNFLERIVDRNLNKRSLEPLIKTGALDEFGDRGVMLANSENLLKYNKELSKKDQNQDSLFGMFDGPSADGKTKEAFTLEPAPNATMKDKLNWEKELLGVYISGHPLDKYRATLERQQISIKKIKDIPTTEAAEAEAIKSQIDAGKPIGGIIEEVREIMTKNNEPMAFIKLADFTGSIDAVVFPKTYAQMKDSIKPDKCIAAICKVSERNGEMSLIIERLKVLE